jgi:hypothetical protein
VTWAIADRDGRWPVRQEPWPLAVRRQLSNARTTLNRRRGGNCVRAVTVAAVRESRGRALRQFPVNFSGASRSTENCQAQAPRNGPGTWNVVWWCRIHIHKRDSCHSPSTFIGSLDRLIPLKSEVTAEESRSLARGGRTEVRLNRGHCFIFQ